jgi:hypothetical protein
MLADVVAGAILLAAVARSSIVGMVYRPPVQEASSGTPRQESLMDERF